jgi:hypothetical protein
MELPALYSPQSTQAFLVIFAFIVMAVCNGLVTSPSLGTVHHSTTARQRVSQVNGVPASAGLSPSCVSGLVKITNAQIANTHPVYGLPTGATFAVW